MTRLALALLCLPLTACFATWADDPMDAVWAELSEYGATDVEPAAVSAAVAAVNATVADLRPAGTWVIDGDDVPPTLMLYGISDLEQLTSLYETNRPDVRVVGYALRLIGNRRTELVAMVEEVADYCADSTLVHEYLHVAGLSHNNPEEWKLYDAYEADAHARFRRIHCP